MRAQWAPYRLDFRFLARTSRESMRHKHTYFVRVSDSDGRSACGECALFRGLSADDCDDYEHELARRCAEPESIADCTYSSIRFGIETALESLSAPASLAAGTRMWKSGELPIPINGLIWMGDKLEMTRRIDAKLAEGFKVLKLKIGGISFDDELDLLKYVRSQYAPDRLELRLDANGSFSGSDAMRRLEALAPYAVHSIEQPVKAGQPELMARLCASSPIPIALDEELIGVTPEAEMRQRLEYIRPAYIILKPALCGGLSGARRWVAAAEATGTGYWFTSALESNIGLDAIAGLAAGCGVSMPQGLGTGELYINNVEGPVYRSGDKICFNPQRPWILPKLDWTTKPF